MSYNGRGAGPLASFVLSIGFGMYLIGALIFYARIRAEDERFGIAPGKRKDSHLSLALWWPVIAANSAAIIESERYANEASK